MHLLRSSFAHNMAPLSGNNLVNSECSSCIYQSGTLGCPVIIAQMTFPTEKTSNVGRISERGSSPMQACSLAFQHSRMFYSCERLYRSRNTLSPHRRGRVDPPFRQRYFPV